MKLDPYLTPCTKVNTTCVKNLNVGSEIIKLLEEIRGNVLGSDFFFFFLDLKPKAQAIKVKITKWTLRELY